MPKGDILVHAGDFTSTGMPGEVREHYLSLRVTRPLLPTRSTDTAFVFLFSILRQFRVIIFLCSTILLISNLSLSLSFFHMLITHLRHAITFFWAYLFPTSLLFMFPSALPLFAICNCQPLIVPCRITLFASIRYGSFVRLALQSTCRCSIISALGLLGPQRPSLFPVSFSSFFH